MQYLFESGREVPVILPPHGNAKIDTTLIRCTQKSTLSKMKDTSGKPKSVVSYLSSEKGGIIGATSCSELPRNRCQVYNSQCLSASNKSFNSSGRADPIFELIQQCSVDLAPGGRKFIRSVNFETSPSYVLSTMISYRFYTNPGSAYVLGIDPTFNMGKFYVTMTIFTYTHIIRKGTDISPTLFGPLFVHTEKNYESYYYFFSTLLKLEPRLTRIIAVATDRELAITKALKAVFGESVIHLRCFIHMKDNIRRKLTDFFITRENQRGDHKRYIWLSDGHNVC